MPKLRVLKADDILDFLKQNSFVVDRQKGSHITLVRNVSLSKQVVTIPNHKEIQVGTTKSIYNQLKKFISQEDLDKFFYK